MHLQMQMYKSTNANVQKYTNEILLGNRTLASFE